jgi:beta-lactamase regulating signal transducer with metallopeptidase domain
MTEVLGHEMHAAAPALLTLFLRSVLLLAAAAIIVRLLHRTSAALRHLVWASALLALLVLPLASALAPTISLRILPPLALPPASSFPEVSAPAAGSAVREPDDVAAGVQSVASTDGRQRRAVTTEAAPYTPLAHAGSGDAERSYWSWRSTLVALWAGVALVLLVEVARSRFRLRRLATGAWRIHDPAWWRAAARIGSTLGLRRPVLLMVTARTSVPLTWGWRAPVVLLPADAHRWPAERREAVLVHELAHVARGDALGHDIARLVAALFWPNPLVWIALRGMRSERERACDDLVLVTGTRASSYAGDLLEIARTTVATRQTAAAALAMARPGELEGRLLAILDAATPREPVTRALRIRGAVLALALVVPLSALRPVERSAAEARAIVVPPSPGVRLPAEVPVIGEVPFESGDLHRGALKLDTMPGIPPATAGLVALEPSDLEPLLESQQGIPRAPAEQREDDVETLIAVARAAAGISSSNDKAELLLAVLERGVLNDSLQRTILRSASTISSSFERHRVLLAMLRDDIVPGLETVFLRAAEGITGHHERALVLAAFANGHGLVEASVRNAYLRAARSITSTHELSQLLALAIRLPEFDAAAAIDVLPAIKALTSSYEKANLLVALGRRGVAGDPAVRAAFLSAVSTLPSSSEYRRVLDAAGLVEPDPRR